MLTLPTPELDTVFMIYLCYGIVYCTCSTNVQSVIGNKGNKFFQVGNFNIVSETTLCLF